MKPHIRSGVLTLLYLTLIPSAFAATWFADGVNGSDSNNCQAATSACKTIGHAIGLASSGDIINVAAANYSENITIPFSLSILGAGPGKSNLAGLGNASVVTIPYQPTASKVILSGLTIQHGNSLLDGGGISNFGQLTVSNTIISSNTALFGGGIATHSGPANNTTLDIDKSELYYNKAIEGGGIHCTGFASNTVRITNSTFVGNTATQGGNGGGIFSSCRMIIVNSTFSRNEAGGLGGAYYSSQNPPNFLNATIGENFASDGGGVFNGGLFLNSIIAGNIGGNCEGKKAESNGYNLSDDDTCDFNQTGDLNDTDPMLGPLTNNGGPTTTMAISPGSPAINAGNPNGCTSVSGASGPILTNDQRGDKRPGDPNLQTGCDMGAYEYQFPQ